MSWISRICNGRFFSAPPTWAARKSKLRPIICANLNPDIQIDTFETRLTSENALDLFKDYDIIVDGTDNFPTRYLVNDACVLLGKPNVYGSIFRFEGQITIFGAPGGPCYRCLYPEPPPPGLVPSCAEGGVLGVLPGIVGTIQAAETLKLIIGKGDPLDRPAAAVRRPGNEIPRTEAAQESGMPGLRRSSDCHQAHRLRRNSAAFAARKLRQRRPPFRKLRRANSKRVWIAATISIFSTFASRTNTRSAISAAT